MSGIVVIISRETPDACRNRLTCMLASLKVESACSAGTCFAEKVGVYVGWKGHKDAFDDCLPIRTEDGNCTLLLAGEVYPEPEEIASLRKGGHDVSGLDARYLIHQYEAQGIEFVRNLNGRFSGVLVDERTGRCFLFNDRYGMKRLFVHEAKDSICIASQAKAILAIAPETREFDPAGLAEYITCGCTLGTGSLFRDIRVMPAASLWTAAKGVVESKQVYFDRAEWEDQERLDERRYTDAVMEMFPAVIRKYGKAQTPVGISLTGGLDTRMLVACLDMQPGEFPCYTFASMYRDTYDVTIAREVARRCGQDHTALVLGGDFLRDFPRYMEGAVYQSDGYLGLPGAAELYVNSLAREIAPIRLTGNYGSELLRGARAFTSAKPRGGLLRKEFDSYVEQAQRTFGALAGMDPLSFALFHQAPHLGYGRSGIEDSQVVMRTPFLDNGLAKFIYRRPAGYEGGAGLSISIIERYRPDLARIPTDRGNLGNGGLVGNWMIRAYREALFKGEYWASHGMPQWVALLTRRIPWLSPAGRVLGRHKFQHYTRWLRETLPEYVRGILLSDAALPHCFERRSLEEMVVSHLEGRRNYEDEIDKALTIVLTAKLLFHQDRPATQDRNTGNDMTARGRVHRFPMRSPVRAGS